MEREKLGVLRVAPKIHKEVRIVAAMEGSTMRAWVEKALTAALPDRARVLIDEREPYTVKEATE